MSKMEQAQLLELLQKPITFCLNESGSDEACFSNEAMIAAINAARLTGRAALHVHTSSLHGQPRDTVSEWLGVTPSQLKKGLELHQLFSGEFAMEVTHSNLIFEEEGLCEVDEAFSRITVICTDHPNQRGYKPQAEASPEQAKTSE